MHGCCTALVLNKIIEGNKSVAVKIRSYNPGDWAQVSKLSVMNDQLKYVASIDYLFRNRKANWDYFVIELNDTIVGFFNLDTAYWKEYEFAAQGEFGIRSFFIDQRFQGQGYARQAVLLLPDHIFQHYLNCPSLCLTVNCKNPVAYQSYLAGGFLDTHELYLGGAAGPQHIMRVVR
jgi:RimJ/RimL family protein N-acetyltransferase